MPPQGFDHYILHVPQLVGRPAWLVGVGHLRGWRIHKLWRVWVCVSWHDDRGDDNDLLVSVIFC